MAELCGADAAMAHRHAARDRAREADPEAEPSERRPRAHYLEEVQGERGAMRRPRPDVGRSWRSGGERRDGPPRGERGKQEAVWDRPNTAPEGGRRRPPSPRRPPARPSQRQADLLASTASDINRFKNDGSFLQALQAGSAEEVGKAAPQREEEPDAEGGRELAEAEEAAEEYRLPPERSAQDGLMLAQLQQQAAPRVPSPEGPPPAAAPARPASGNQSVADALRARLMGRAAPAASAAAPAAAAGGGRQAVALPLVDASGRAAPGAFGRKTAGADALPEGNRIPKQTQRSFLPLYCLLSLPHGRRWTMWSLTPS